MPSIGESLREARMRQHLDISDVEEQTKIRAKYLRALENEDFGLLPGPTFVKTFLRTYAEVLGLDPHLLVEEYRASFEPSDELEPPQALGGPPAPPGRPERHPPPPGVLVAVLVVGLLVFLIVLGVTGGGGNNGSKKRSASTTSQTTKAKKHKRHKKRPAPSIMALRVQPTLPTYVCVDRGAGTPIVYQGILSAPQTFKGRILRVNLGKTSVQLLLNGKSFPTGGGAQPVGFEFTRTGSKPLPVGERPCA
jgi:cytoskeleton protein RodZ